MKRRLAKADAQGARFGIIIGDNELAKGVAFGKGARALARRARWRSMT